MAQTEITITIDDDYVVPEGPLTPAQYVVFVANKAAESYKNQYNTVDFLSGVHAACDAYNAVLPQPVEPEVE
jgi:hypothetical protein